MSTPLPIPAQRKKDCCGFVFAVCLTVALFAGLILAARWDLPLAHELYALWQKSREAFWRGDTAPWYLWSCFARALAGLPGWGGIALLGFGLATGFEHLPCRERGKTVLFFTGCLLLPIGCVVTVVSVLRPLAEDGILRQGAPGSGLAGQLLLGLLLGAACVAAVLFGRFSAPLRRKTLTAALLYSGFDLGYVVFSNLGKLIWQRTRFDFIAAAGDTSAFTGWFQLPGNGGSSFPSGHTASAGVLLALVLLCRLFAPTRDDEKGFLFLGYAFALFVGFGRMLSGRHYLSDVLASILLDSLLLCLGWYLPCVRKALNQALHFSASAVPFAMLQKHTRSFPPAAPTGQPKKLFRSAQGHRPSRGISYKSQSKVSSCTQNQAQPFAAEKDSDLLSGKEQNNL